MDSVIHIVTSLDFGGVERHMEIIASVQDRGSMRHSFLALGNGGRTHARLAHAGAEVLCLNSKVGIPNVRLIARLVRLFRNQRPFVVHTHGAEANFHGLLAASIANVPVRFGEEIGIPSHSARARQVFRHIYGRANRVIGISDAVAKWLVESGEVSQEKAVCVYNPVALPHVDRRTPPPNNLLRVGFVGRFETVKNPVALVEAVAALHSRGVPCELWMIGDGTERARIERVVAQYAIGHQVRLFGYQPDPAEFVHQCHVYVQPSLAEGFGIALVEAMACGVPVAATQVGGAPEIVSDGYTGWLLPDGSPSNIGAALEAAWKLGPERLAQMGKRARDSVLNRFDPVDYLGRIESLYRQVATDKNNQ